MNKLFFLTFLILSSIESFAQEKNEILYINCKDSPLLKIEFKHKEFKILKHKFRNKKLREQYKANYYLNKVPYQSMYLTFVYYKNSENKSDISNVKLTSIEDVSSYKINISHSTRVYFIVRDKCGSYDFYETTLEFEE